MKNLKILLLKLSICISSPLLGAERPPQPPKVVGNSVEVEELLKKIATLPAELRQELLNTYFYAAYPNTKEMANRIRLLQDLVTSDGLLNLLKSFPKTFKVIDLIIELGALPITTQMPMSQKLTKWLQNLRLESGAELFEAVSAPNPDLSIVQSFLENPNIDLNARDGHFGLTPLMMASGNGRIDIARALLAADAYVNAKDFEGRTPLMFASAAGHKEIAEMLLAAGANINARNNQGETALLRASFNGYVAVVRALLAVGANVDIPTNMGHTPLALAAQGGHIDAVRALLEANPDLNARVGDLTALGIARQQGHAQIVKLLEDAARSKRCAIM